MFYARYVVLQFGKKEVPFLISDADNHGWERPRGNTKPFPNEVLSAGFVTWEEGDRDSVVCFGSGKMSLDSLRGTTREVNSRKEVDAALIQALLSKPLNYVVLRLDYVDYAVLSSKDKDHERIVLGYQVYPSKCAVSAGEVDFGFATKETTRCYGEGIFLGFKPIVRPSRGAEDVAFMSKHLVKHMDNPEPPRSYRLFL